MELRIPPSYVEQEVGRDGEVVADSRTDVMEGERVEEKEGKSITRETHGMTCEMIREYVTCQLISCGSTSKERCDDKTRRKEDRANARLPLSCEVRGRRREFARPLTPVSGVAAGVIRSKEENKKTCARREKREKRRLRLKGHKDSDDLRAQLRKMKRTRR
ncbi:hypothetical protein ALC57_17297 [Trachymyrmex cornetzi]|uniref:Uncharacterized protein n=1 Tax=Trachymyrmex cornetzi TaxID=471704 RepID=A0A195DCQ4_9HYME|nr:hypothetical protein ALC57_17297 [Trachymyrmex cornetzi]